MQAQTGKLLGGSTISISTYFPGPASKLGEPYFSKTRRQEQPGRPKDVSP